MKQLTILFLAALLSGAPQAFSQVVYYNLMPDVVMNSWSSYSIQIDTPPTANISNSRSVLTVWEEISSQIDVNASTNNCEVLLQNGLPAALTEGETISGNATWQSPNHLVLFDGTTGNWQNKTNRYLGVRVQAGGGQWYYGWIRMDVSNAATTVTIKDYACNMTAGAPLFAGQISSTGVTDAALNDNESINIYCQNKKLNFSGTNGQTFNIRLTDMSGRTIKQYAYKGEPIDMTGYVPGIYLVTLQNDKIKKSFKVVI